MCITVTTIYIADEPVSGHCDVEDEFLMDNDVRDEHRGFKNIYLFFVIVVRLLVLLLLLLTRCS